MDEKTQPQTLRPRWIDSAQPELKRLSGRNCGKKRTTIMAVLAAELLDQRVDWTRPDLCGRSTWYDLWQHDPLIQEVLTNVREIILDARLEDAAAAVDEALTIIQLAAPDAARAIVAIMRGTDKKQARLAADSILNRASATTAEKGKTESRLSAAEIAMLREEADQELKEWQQAQETAADDPPTASEGIS